MHEAEAVRPRATAKHVTVEQRAAKFIHYVAVTPRHGSALAHFAEKNANVVVPPGRISSEVVKALQLAQQKAEADPAVLLAIAWKESRFDPLARNKQSSARGLLQFTEATWLTVIRDFGGRHGLTHYAAAIRTDRDGRLSVENPKVRRAILALRDHPDLQAIMAAERLAQERGELEKDLGRPVGSADLYVLHLLGPTGARSFLTQLTRNPEGSSVASVGQVARPNRGLFVRDGRTLSVAEAYAGMQATLEEQAALHADLFAQQHS